MSRIYYQLIWYFMKLPWAIRILIELPIYFLLLKLSFWVLKKIGEKLKLKIIAGKIFVYLGTWAVAIAGGTQGRWKELDKKIIEKGHNIAYKPFALPPIVHKIIWLGFLLCYLFCVIPDTKAFLYFDGNVAQSFLNVKDTFAKLEEKWTSGYQQYAPTPVKEVSAPKKSSSKKIAISLNSKRAKNGVYIYQAPSNKSKKLMKLKGGEKLFYKNRTKKVKKDYWLKVYAPGKKVNGWIKKAWISEKSWKAVNNLTMSTAPATRKRPPIL